jgi:hypothetical protein
MAFPLLNRRQNVHLAEPAQKLSARPLLILRVASASPPQVATPFCLILLV